MEADGSSVCRGTHVAAGADEWSYSSYECDTVYVPECASSDVEAASGLHGCELRTVDVMAEGYEVDAECSVCSVGNVYTDAVSCL